jgi:hypothetical protein
MDAELRRMRLGAEATFPLAARLILHEATDVFAWNSCFVRSTELRSCFRTGSRTDGGAQ